MSEGGKLLPFRGAVDADSELSSESLVLVCASGDRAALGVLFERFHLPVYRFLSRFVGRDSSELDDLVQTTFLEVMRAAPRFRQDSAVQTWIFGIAVNVVRHHRRSELRRRSLSTALYANPLPTRQGLGPGHEHSVERLEMISRLEQALASLPHDLRTAFVMCELEDISGVEAARVLNWSPGTLWRRLNEARQTLRRILTEEPHEKPELQRSRSPVTGLLPGRGH